MRDSSLDEFVGSDPDGEDATDDGPDAVEPARATSAFDPSGRECEACGDRVERRWRDGDAMVCGECKDW